MDTISASLPRSCLDLLDGIASMRSSRARMYCSRLSPLQLQMFISFLCIKGCFHYLDTQLDTRVIFRMSLSTPCLEKVTSNLFFQIIIP